MEPEQLDEGIDDTLLSVGGMSGVHTRAINPQYAA
jgi:hypothetical protein